MRVLRAAAILTLMLTGPVFAQKPAPPPPPQDAAKSQTQLDAEKSQDKAYRNSLSNIPDKPPADPWGGARAIDTPSSAPTTTSSKRSKSN